VYGFGWTHYGQIGIGPIGHGEQGELLPRLIEGLQGHRVIEVAVAEQHTLVLSNPA